MFLLFSFDEYTFIKLFIPSTYESSELSVLLILISCQRLIPFIFQESLQSFFDTGNVELNELLEQAKEKYLSPDSNPTLRREALEKLWDAWERLKTMENPSNKVASIQLLFDKASNEPKFKERLDKEGTELTNIGNSFYIRHTELSQTPINSGDHFDYLFQRMFAMIHLLLKARK